MDIYMQPTAFPCELTDLIVDKVAERDYAGLPLYKSREARRLRQVTLKSCSLVARSWLPTSRRYLFHSVRLDHWDPPKRKSFLKLLDSPYTTIAPHVRHLELQDGRSVAKPKKASWLNVQLPRLMALTSIESLAISNAKFQFLSRLATTQFFQGFPQLRELEINCLCFADLTQLSHALSVLPQLKHLSVYHCAFKHAPQTDRLSLITPSLGTALVSLLKQGRQRLNLRASEHAVSSLREELPHPPDDTLPLPPPNLTILGIHTLNAIEKAEILQWLGTRPSVEFLSMSTITASQSLAVAQYLCALGPSLKQLVIGFCNQGSDGTDAQIAFCRDVGLRDNTNLHTIHFTSLHIDTDYTGLHPQLLHICQILAKITHPNIREVKIEVHIKSIDDLHALDWDAIEMIISQPNYSNLKRLVVLPWGWLDDLQAETRRWMAERIPVTQARGVIFCE